MNLFILFIIYLILFIYLFISIIIIIIILLLVFFLFIYLVENKTVNLLCTTLHVYRFQNNCFYESPEDQWRIFVGGGGGRALRAPPL